MFPGKTADEIDRRFETRVVVTAGQHDVGVTFAKKSSAARQEVLQPFQREKHDARMDVGIPELDQIVIEGPLTIAGPGRSPSRERIFSCEPAQDSEAAACAEQILTALARRAYRRPITDDERDAAARRSTAPSARRAATSRPACRRRSRTSSSRRSSCSASSRIRPTPRPARLYRISDLELASRLSFFLWSSLPDDELIDAAVAGKLGDPDELERQVERMLADERATTLAKTFASQWLYLRNLRASAPDMYVFPDFDDNLRQSAIRETELLFETIVREDRPLTELLSADYTFLNERLAKHYGIPNLYGDQFRRVARDRRAPLRPARAREHPDAVVVPEPHVAREPRQLRADEHPRHAAARAAARTCRRCPRTPPRSSRCARAWSATAPIPSARAVTSSWTRSASCSSATTASAAGAPRTTARPVGDYGSPIHVLRDFGPIDGPVDLRNAILSQPERFVRTATEKLMTYALGRQLDGRRHADGPRDRPPGGRRRLPVLVARARHRDERRVPNADCRRKTGRDGCARFFSLERRDAYVHQQEALVPPHGLEGRRRRGRAAAARRDGAGAHGARADGGRADAALRHDLHSARRDHGRLDAEEGRHRLRAADHLEAARRASRALQRRHGPLLRRRERALGVPRLLLRVRARAARQLGRAQHVDRPSHRAEDRPGHDVPVDGARDRGQLEHLRHLRRRLPLHLHGHDLVAHADAAAADGAEPARRVRAHVRRRRHDGRGAPRAARAEHEHSRRRRGRRARPRRKAGRPRSRAARRVSRERARGRAAHRAGRGPALGAPARGAADAERHSRVVRGAREPDVRAPSARVPGRPHARDVVHDGPRALAV